MFMLFKIKRAKKVIPVQTYMILKSESVIKDIPRKAPEISPRFKPDMDINSLYKESSRMVAGYQEGRPNPYLEELMGLTSTKKKEKKLTRIWLTFFICLKQLTLTKY